MKSFDVAEVPASPLETPGSIAVIGGGILGVEAALYGRYLGYDVSLWEAQTIGHRWIEAGDAPLPTLPDRSCSPLAARAISAQRQSAASGDAFDAASQSLPVTCGDWAMRILRPLSQSDLLSGRVHENSAVAGIDLSAIDDSGASDGVDPRVDPSDDAGADDEVPPDFQLRFVDGRDPMSFEAVIVAIEDPSAIEVTFPIPADYLFHLRRGDSGDAETALAMGLKSIVSVYANLADRAGLDLYMPVRGND